MQIEKLEIIDTSVSSNFHFPGKETKIRHDEEMHIQRRNDRRGVVAVQIGQVSRLADWFLQRGAPHERESKRPAIQVSRVYCEEAGKEEAKASARCQTATNKDNPVA